MATSQYSCGGVSAAARPARVGLSAWLAAGLALAIAAYFWIDSRYPSLLKKLSSGKGIHVSAPLSFDALLPVSPQMPLWTRIGYTALDWAWTNRIGMSFGVCFGAAVLTFLAYVPRRRFAGAFANTALGAVIGAPLGVCANCVAPVGRGLFQGGASAATMLAAMIASPTLNVVVMVMAFTLLPLPMALLRLAAPLVLLALVPLLVGSAGKQTGDAYTGAACPIEVLPSRAPGVVAKTYLLNLWRLALATVPWMVLAGLLGALVVELVPAQAIPSQVTVVGLIAVALLGTFAPMPIAFDVAFGWILLSRGVPEPYVATLVCTLGAFSIYPFFIVGRSLSWLVAARVYAAVMVVGLLAGVLAMLL
jgi:uncharacterized membrane protein YraQ (UPF0718 family)